MIYISISLFFIDREPRINGRFEVIGLTQSLDHLIVSDLVREGLAWHEDTASNAILWPVLGHAIITPHFSGFKHTHTERESAREKGEREREKDREARKV